MLPDKEILEDDDLEEGEVKDDDDDDDDEDEIENPTENKKDDELSDRKSSSSEAEATPPRPPSSSSSSASSPPSSSSSSSSSSSPESSSSSSSSSSALSPSSKSSSRVSCRRVSPSRRNGTSNSRNMKSVISSRRLSEDGMAEKAAKLISMRTKLLEARSREFELRLSKGKPSAAAPSAPTLTLIEEKNVKMTIAEPVISYSENPNPPPEQAPTTESPTKRKSKSKPKGESKERKSKKSKKKKKSPKKSKRHKRNSSSSKKSFNDSKSNTSPALELPYEEFQENQGPRTPPDNHVLTLDDEQIEWPSHLIRMTICEPSISYSVNPASVMEQVGEDDGRISHKRRSSRTASERKKSKVDETRSSVSSSPIRRQTPANSIDDGASSRKYSSPRAPTQESDLNADYTWFYSYFIDSYEMDHKQARHQALTAIISSGIYGEKQLENWLSSKGMTRVTDIMLHKPAFPFTLRDSAYNPSSRRERKTEDLDSLNRKFKRPIERVVTRIARNQHDDDVSNNENILTQEEKTLPKVEEKTGEDEPVGNGVEQSSDNHDSAKVEQSQSTETSQLNEPSMQTTIRVKIESVGEQPEAPQPKLVLPAPIRPRYTMVKSQKEIVLPNGQVLPPGTIQKFVHPYPRIDSEVLGPFYDLY